MTHMSFVRRHAAAAALALTLTAAGLNAETIIVSPGQSIQAAIAAAADGDHIVVNPGAYTETIDLLGKAITLRSAQGAAATTIAAPGTTGSVIRCGSQETRATVIEGFTVTGGSASTGGGILIVGSSPVIQSCVFTDNQATLGGGGANLGGSPLFRLCAFSLNTAQTGGGFYSTGPAIFSACTFDRNDSGLGGGMHAQDAPQTLTRCEFGSNGGLKDVGAGAGLNLLRSDSTLTDCIFTGNKQVSGGGLRTEDASPVVTGCIFTSNSCEAGPGGGALLIGGAPRLVGCDFRFNVANFDTGAALAIQASDAVVIDAGFTANHCFSASGASGVSLDGGSPSIARCHFTRNEGGAAVEVLAGSPLVANCLITANAADLGAGVTVLGGSPVIANCTLAGNTAREGGGLAFGGGEPVVVGCTVVGNTAGLGGAAFYFGGSPSISTSIIWSNTSSKGGPPIESIPGGSTLSITYSCVQGGWPGEGNISADPMLAADSRSAYRLLPGSPCIDAGSNAAFPADAADLDADGDTTEPLPLDLRGLPRFIDDPGVSEPAGVPPPVADMGAAEFQADTADCPADWDADGVSNSRDLSAFLNAWGQSMQLGPWLADMNANGVIDSGDISVFLERWLMDVDGC